MITPTRGDNFKRGAVKNWNSIKFSACRERDGFLLYSRGWGDIPMEDKTRRRHGIWLDPGAVAQRYLDTSPHIANRRIAQRGGEGGEGGEEV